VREATYVDAAASHSRAVIRLNMHDQSGPQGILRVQRQMRFRTMVKFCVNIGTSLTVAELASTCKKSTQTDAAPSTELYAAVAGMHCVSPTLTCTAWSQHRHAPP
jgi:hypothetical protein